MSGGCSGRAALMEDLVKSRTCVWRWQERFMTEGVAGLLHDKSTPPPLIRMRAFIARLAARKAGLLISAMR